MEVAHNTGAVQPLQLSSLFDQLTVECRFVSRARVHVRAEKRDACLAAWLQMCVRVSVKPAAILRAVHFDMSGCCCSRHPRVVCCSPADNWFTLSGSTSDTCSWSRASEHVSVTPFGGPGTCKVGV